MEKPYTKVSLKELQETIPYLNISWVDVINSVSAIKVTPDDFVLIEYYEGGQGLAKVMSKADKKALADRFTVYFIYKNQSLFGIGLWTKVLEGLMQNRRKKCFIELSSSFFPVLNHLHNRAHLEPSMKIEAEKMARDAALSVSRRVDLDENLSNAIKEEIKKKLGSLEIQFSYMEPEKELKEFDDYFTKVNVTGNEGNFLLFRKLNSIEKPRVDYNFSDNYNASANVLCKLIQSIVATFYSFFK